MAFNGTGQFVPLAPPTYPAVAGQLIRADYFNAIMTDLMSGLSSVMTRSGQAPMVGNLPLGGFRATGAGDAVSATDLVTKQQLDAVGAATEGGELNFLSFVSDAAVKASILNGTCVTDLTSAFAAFRAALVASPVRRQGYFPAGLYTYATSPNWAIERLSIRSDGARFRCTGTGDAFLCDALLPDAVGFITNYCFSIQWSGRTYLEVTATGKNAAYIRGVHHSIFEGFNCRSAGAGYSGLCGAFMVCTQFPNFVCSANEAPWYLGLTPAFGITLTNQVVGPDFGTTSYCLFTCPIIEQVPIGVRLVSTLGNLFIGGTIENCTDTGVYGLSGCNQDKFIGIDHELNTNNDYSIAGNGVEIIDCDTLTRVLFSGSGNRLRGGKHKSFDCQVGSSDNTFQDAIWNRTGGGGYLVDSGTYNGFPRVRNAANSWFGRPLSIQSITVTASPMTILNNTGDDQYYVISGGTLTGLFIGRFGGGQPITYFTGSEIRVGPGEALALSYTIAPTITAYK